MDDARLTVIQLVFILSLGINVFAIVALKRCRKLAYNVKVFSINLALGDLLVCISGITSIQLELQGKKDKYKETCWLFIISQIMVIWSFFTASLMVTAIAADRLASIAFPFRYLAFLTSRRCKTVCILLWFITFVISIFFLIENLEQFSACRQTGREGVGVKIGIQYTRFHTMAVVNILLLLMNVILHSSIFVFIRKNKTRVNGGQFLTLRKLLTISLVYAVVQGPFCLTTIVAGFTSYRSAEMVAFIEVTSLMAAFTVVVDPFLYSWRYQACRLQMKMMLLCCDKKRKEKTQRYYKQLYSTYVIDVDMQELGIPNQVGTFR